MASPAPRVARRARRAAPGDALHRPALHERRLLPETAFGAARIVSSERTKLPLLARPGPCAGSDGSANTSSINPVMFFRLEDTTIVCVSLSGLAPPTTITILNMHCEACAAQIEASLLTVPGVAAVKSDLSCKAIIVRPNEGARPSPRQLWEAVEKTEHRPMVLQGPSGTFTAKPKH